MSAYDKIILRKRILIDSVMDSLKNICQLEHSRHRSIYEFIINIFAAIGAYHLASHFEAGDSNSLQLCV